MIMQSVRRFTSVIKTKLRNVWNPKVPYSSNAPSRPINMAYSLFTSTSASSDAPPLLIMHGLFGSKKNWRSMSKALQTKFIPNRQVITVDARNHGESPHTTDHTYEHLAEDINFFLKEQNINKVVILGHSMGGRAMMYFALKYPNLVDRAIIVDISPFDMPRDFMQMENIFVAMKSIDVPSSLPMAAGRQKVEQQLRSALVDKGTVEFIIQNLKKLDSGHFVWSANVSSLHRNFRNITNFPKNIIESHQYRGPTLFIGGTHSNFINKDDWPQIQQIFPNATISWVEAGHLVHFEQPQEFINLVTKFLNDK